MNLKDWWKKIKYWEKGVMVGLLFTLTYAIIELQPYYDSSFELSEYVVFYYIINSIKHIIAFSIIFKFLARLKSKSQKIRTSLYGLSLGLVSVSIIQILSGPIFTQHDVISQSLIPIIYPTITLIIAIFGIPSIIYITLISNAIIGFSLYLYIQSKIKKR